VKHAVKMGSVAMIYIHTKFHKGWFRNSKVDKGDSETHRQDGNIIRQL
jgi:hypothetical protein